MDNRIMQEVLNALAEQRAKNEREEMRRRQEVIGKCPEIGEVMAKRQQTVLASIYSAFQLPVEENLEETESDEGNNDTVIKIVMIVVATHSKTKSLARSTTK